MSKFKSGYKFVLDEKELDSGLKNKLVIDKEMAKNFLKQTGWTIDVTFKVDIENIDNLDFPFYFSMCKNDKLKQMYAIDKVFIDNDIYYILISHSWKNSEVKYGQEKKYS